MSSAAIHQQLSEMLAQRGERTKQEGEGVPLRGTGIPALDQLLVGGGLPAGCLMEWLEPEGGGGVDTLALWAAVRARRPNELLLVVDSRGDFYPPAGIPLGLDIRTTVVVRTSVRPGVSAHRASAAESRDLLWAVEQALRTRGVGVVVCWWERLSSQACRRLQLAAEKGGSLGVLVRPTRIRGEPSFAEVRWGVQVLPSTENRPTENRPTGKPVQRWRVELRRARRQLTGGSVDLELHHDEDRLRLVSSVVAAARVAESPPGFPPGDPAGDPPGDPPGDPSGDPSGDPPGDPPGFPAGDPAGEKF